MSQKMVQFPVSSDLIREALAMPDGTRVYNIVRHDYLPGVFVFYVENPDFDEVREGEIIPEVLPVIKADYTKKPSTWLTFYWVDPEITEEES